jgi:hypothetical protein
VNFLLPNFEKGKKANFKNYASHENIVILVMPPKPKWQRNCMNLIFFLSHSMGKFQLGFNLFLTLNENKYESTLEIIQMRSHGIPCDFHTPSVKTYMGLKKIRVRFRLNFVCKCLSDRTG